LYADRAPKKSRVLSTKQQFDKEQITSSTAVEWARIIHSDEFGDRVIHTCAKSSESEWYAHCQLTFTNHVLPLVTGTKFRACCRAGNLEAACTEAEAWLRSKPIQQQKKGIWSQPGAALPLWCNEDALSGAEGGAGDRFDCLILEPFSHELDPTFLLDAVGSAAIARAAHRLALGLDRADSAQVDTNLLNLRSLTVSQQHPLREAHELVRNTVSDWITEVLAAGLGVVVSEVVSFGSSQLGTATAESDVDLMVLSETSLPPHSLVRYMRERYDP